MKKYTLKLFLVMIMFFTLIFVNACDENFASGTYKTLETNAVIYNTAKVAIKDLHKTGVISDKQLKEAIDIGNKYYTAHQAVSELLRSYIKISSADKKEQIAIGVEEMVKFLGELTGYLKAFGVDIS